ncbi:DUF2892 domain-containing protein [Vibrio nigripulchritudo]|uniref:YgaP family membrane protein n=1 Tax=Vibrio nigripulchritudo TaxID=28173 RepID=UPI0003B1C6FB|nr:DUF2892 domain-containing protein [Vibrio nigripulchritudo]CCN68644.1 conserved hypothetical protein [Vibrio nigripulchritudo SFn118]
MTLENGVRLLAGTMILLSVILTMTISPHFVWLTVFVGVNLIQSVFTRFCLATIIFKKMGFE